MPLARLDGFGEASREVDAHWHSRSPAERVEHVEVLRQLNYGPAALEPMKKVLKVVSLSDLR